MKVGNENASHVLNILYANNHFEPTNSIFKIIVIDGKMLIWNKKLIYKKCQKNLYIILTY